MYPLWIVPGLTSGMAVVIIATFLSTFLMGLLIIAYLPAVAYKSGRVEGPYEASPSMQRLGRLSIALLLVRIAVIGRAVQREGRKDKRNRK